MATLRDLAAKAIAAGFTGKNYRNAPTVKPSPRRQQIGNATFDQLGKRQQKIVRRMAMGDVMVPPSDERTWNSLSWWDSEHWQLVSAVNSPRRCCNIRAKDAKALGKLTVELGWSTFSKMLEAIRVNL